VRSSPYHARRPLLGILGAAAVFLLLAYPCFILNLYCLRECYRLATLAGLLDPSAGLGGQILGFNYARNPEWVRSVCGVVATLIGFAPAVTAGLWIFERVARGPIHWRATICGRCGDVLHGLQKPKCPACGSPL
jgi:hypothetical protein